MTGGGALIDDFANLQHRKHCAEAAASAFSRRYTGRSARQGDEGQNRQPPLDRHTRPR